MQGLLPWMFLAACASVGHAWWGIGTDFQAMDEEPDDVPAKYRIVGGTDVVQSVPWMATIGKVYEGQKDPQHFCGGYVQCVRILA